jgi:DNA-binding SARP family transcriptional activator
MGTPEEQAPLRIYLAGSVRLERGSVLRTERDLPGRQGRIAFAHLAAERARAVSRDELAETLWPEALPRAWEVALRSVVSKLRGVLADVGVGGPDAIAHAFGCYQLHLPADTWVDLEAAADAIHRAETSLRSGDPSAANGWSLVANAIARRPFLPGEEGEWVDGWRTQLRGVRVRALECRATVALEAGDPEGAIRDAQLVTDLEPFRESAVRLLMRAHVASGNRAEALLAYERCRRVIADELGTSPAAETEAAYLDILRSPGRW